MFSSLGRALKIDSKKVTVILIKIYMCDYIKKNLRLMHGQN